MLEQQQENILRHPERKLLMLNVDAGGAPSRRILERYLQIENVESSGTVY
jgi:vanillate O-demethylase monooxygenase subunit